MENCVPVHHPFCSSLVLNSTQSPSTEKEKLEMKNIPYRETVGSLMYIACNTRPDIMAATSFVSRYVSNPGLEHWTAVKRILRYLKGTEDLGLVLGGSTSVSLHGYSDADWGGDRDTRKSTTGYVFFIGNGCVSWQTKKQPTTALSTTEAEYLSLSTAFKKCFGYDNCRRTWIFSKNDNYSTRQYWLYSTFRKQQTPSTDKTH